MQLSVQTLHAQLSVAHQYHCLNCYQAVYVIDPQIDFQVTLIPS